TVILWDIATRQPLGPPLTGQAAESVAFSPGGETLALTSTDDTILLWDVSTHQPLGPPLTGHPDFVESVAFSPDGNTLASGSRDGTIIFWDVSAESWKGRACRIANRNLPRAEWKQYLGDEPYRATCAEFPIEPETPAEKQVGKQG